MNNKEKKFNSKKTMAFVLALLITSGCTGTTGLIKASSDFKAAATDNNSKPEAIGKVDITFGSALFIDDTEFNVELKKGTEFSSTKKVTIGNSAENKISFDNLADGKYTLIVTSEGFAEYRQEINVQSKMYTLRITTGFCGGYSYEKGTQHSGVILIGDVDHDGDIDINDKNTLIDAIDSGDLEKYAGADLNRDGKLNLLDLTLFAGSYNTKKETSASVEEFVSPDIINVTHSENTSITGSVEKMLCGEEAITIATTEGEEISEENPISIEFDFEEDGNDSVVDGITIGTGSENPVAEATIDITYVDEGIEITEQVPVKNDTHFILKESEVYAEVDANGNINVHLGKQVAIKRVTIIVTAMQKNNNLAEISKVEFVNGMENRIPEPELDIPEDLKATEGSEQITLDWSPCINVTGYEIKIEQGGKSEILNSVENSIVIKTFGGKELANYTEYKVSVQSVNGTWRSTYCDAVNVTPKPTKKPDKPDNVKASGAFRSVKVSWSKMKDTQSYSVFYKLSNSEDAYTEISNITSTSYTIENLESLAEYEVYVIGHNELGSSPQSMHSCATTTNLDLADMPKYNLINRDENGNPGSTHIVSVKRYGGEMVDSELDADANDTAWGAVDGDKASYYTKATWDDGGFNGIGNNGLTYTFDKEYTMDTIGLLTVNTNIDYTNVRCWDADGNLVYELNSPYGNLSSSQTDKNGKRYYYIKFPKPVTAAKVQISLARYLTSPNTVAETYFYKYDTLMDEVMDLYEDDLHTVLKENVNQELVDDLRNKITSPDEFGELNPNKDALIRELETAEKILQAQSISKPVEIYTSLTTKDTGRGFSGLNAWQPLGVSIGMGEEVTIYVGSDKKKTGDSTNLRLIMTQYHSESGGVTLDGANLKVGANTFKLSNRSLANQENGGAMYIQYQGDPTNERYSVRVTGGSEIPRLDLYKVTDENVRMERAVEFIKKLDEYVPQIEALHTELHTDSKNGQISKAYDEKNCILGASDIMLDTMMISLPAKQIRAGAGTGSVEERAENLLNSMKAMEDMMYLFYQHKGLNASAPAALNQIPKQHLNIRYQRMFSGAFMYASGNHIGIEWGSAPGIMKGVPIVSDEDGRYISGNYFGWGIAHEIGHNINQGAYSVAEITNNYFAQLAQAKDTNEGMRFQYSNIYKKVSSGTKGDCSNIATQLGMYWQLHLAYDQGLNYKTYPNYSEQLANLFYARVDTYARNANAAPKPGGVALTLSGGSDQCLMRLACAAAEKNVLEFFERWGKTPDVATIKYAEQFEKETRAIFYANDDSRIYAREGSGSVLGTECNVKAVSDVSINIGKAQNKVELNFTSSNIPASDILGYEIIRCTISGGQVEEVPVGFTVDSHFTDTVSTLNNRTVFYKVTLIDQYLNRSDSFTTKQVKIQHDGSMDKSNWTIKTTGLTAETVVCDATEEMPCEKTTDNPAEKMIDYSFDTIFAPTVNSNNAEIIIDFNQTLTTTGLKYTAGTSNPVGEYQVYVCEDGNWVLAADGSFNGSGTVYFANDDDEYISTYAATAVKLVLVNQKNINVSIAELDVLGVTGDNVDFRRTTEEKTTVIGTLGKEYRYGEEAEDVIPEGSIIFTGSYKGNPAYSTVLLYDKNGNIVGGIDENNKIKAKQIILADVPDGKDITNVSDGTWIYWIEPEDMENMTMPETVRVELYRVNNALTNEGQRLVSDSLFEEVPANLSSIIISE